MVMRQITDGLVKSRVDASVAEARTETATARERLGLGRRQRLRPRDPAAAAGREPRRPRRGQGLRGGRARPGRRGQHHRRRTHHAGGRRRAACRPACAGPWRSGENGLAWTYTRIRYTDGSDAGAHGDQPGVAVGSTVVLPSDGGTYALYYLFPMGEEQQTLLLLRRVLLTAGVLLLLLVAGVAALVTRQVITPVRLARRVAERIASGRLEERMHVAGEDDIARLAMSFNQMAEALQSQIRKLVELSRVQRTFVSDVSHELRTPLTTVRMAGDVLHDARATFDPVTARAAELLQTELDRFENLLGDLLEISRFDAGAAVLDLEDTNLGDVVHRVVGSDRADGAAARGAGDDPRRGRVHGRGRRTPGRADRAQPADQRDRPRRGQRRHRAARRRRRGHRPDRARPRRRPAARPVGDGVQPVLARRPGPCPHHRRHRPRAGHRARGRAAARRLAAGLGHARAAARSSG